MEEKGVSCYRNTDGNWLIIPMAKDAHGIGVMINRPERLRQEATDPEVGAAVRAALQACDYSLYDPDSNPTGVASWTQFAKRHHQVRVAVSQQIALIPSARDKKGAFWHLKEERVELPITAPDETLGAGIRQTFTKCFEGERKKAR